MILQQVEESLKHSLKKAQALNMLIECTMQGCANSAYFENSTQHLLSTFEILSTDLVEALTMFHKSLEAEIKESSKKV